MRLKTSLTLGLAALLPAFGCHAGQAAPATVLSAASAASAPAQTTPGNTKNVIEDDAVRIEETRLRGQTQRVVVQSKVPGVKAYEILVPPGGGKDPSHDRAGTGPQRAWSLFSF